MPETDPYKIDLGEIDQLFKKIDNPENPVLDQRKNMESVFEGLGQAAWGFSTGITWSLPEISDMVEESVGGQSNRLEDFVTSLPAEILTLGSREGEAKSYSGDFSSSATDRELSLPGKIGYTAGNAIGMLFSFGWLGKIIGGGTAKTAQIAAAKGYGTAGIKTGSELAQSDILQSFGNVVYRAGQKTGAKPLTEEAATEIAKGSFDIIKKSGSFREGYRNLGDGLFSRAATEAIKEEVLKPLMGRSIDDVLLDDFAKETFNIARRFDPSEGMNLINNAAKNLARKKLGDTNKAKIIGGIAGASAYDAILGTVIGATRGLGEYGINDVHGAENNKSVLSHVLGTAFHEAAVFSILGPIKFIRGGTEASALQKTKDMTRGVMNQLRPIKKMSPTQLEANIELLNAISGKNIQAELGGRWAGQTGNWWKGLSKLNVKSPEGKKGIQTMREFLTDARSTFLKRAPGDFTRELGADMIKSLPRMMAGSVAMNLTNLHDTIKTQGVENFMEGFGATDYEKVANIMTAMYFTRKPHSFHLYGAPVPTSIFQTGNIKKYASHKGEQFSKTVTGLNIIGGKNFDSALEIASRYEGMSDTNPENYNNKVFSKSFEQSNEIQNIKSIIKPHSSSEYKTPSDKNASGGLETAGADYISRIKDPGERTLWRNKLSIASDVLKWHDNNSIKTMDISQGLTREHAANLIEKLSSVEFDGKRLEKKEAIEQMDDWLATRIQRESSTPINIIKSFVVDMYKELGVESVNEINGKIVAPRINENLFTSYIDNNTSRNDGSRSNASEALISLVTASKKLEAAGILTFSKGSKLDSVSDSSISESLLVKESAVKRLMQYAHGENWESKAMDNIILRLDPWYITQARLNARSQKLNTEYVLRGTGETSLDKNNANQMYKDLRDELSGNRFPNVVDKDGEILGEAQISQRADLSSAVKDLKRVHNLLGLTNPESSSSSARDLNPGKMLEMHNKWKKLLGDVVTSDESFFEMQSYLINKGIKQLGISNMSGGYNMHAAIHQLSTSREFMRDTGMEIPNLKLIKDMVNAKIKSTELSLNDGKEIKDYYTNVVKTISDAGLGVIKIKDMVEQQPGAWYESIRSSMLLGKGRASQLAVDNLIKTIDISEKFQEQHDRYGQELLFGASQREANTNPEKNLSTIWEKRSEGNRQVIDQLKRALESGDGLVVHAFHSRLKSIDENFKLAEEALVDGEYNKYLQKIVKLTRESLDEAHRNGWTEQNVTEESKKIMDRMSIPEKDRMQVGLKVSSSQFAQKYNLNISDMTEMFLSYKSMNKTMDKTAESILKGLDAIDLGQKIGAEGFKTDLYSPEQVKQILDQREHVKKVLAKKANPDPNEFFNDIVKPLITSLQMKEVSKNSHNINFQKGGLDRFTHGLLSDISSITTAYFSSMPVKQYTYRNSELFLADKQVGYTEKHGLQGVISALNGTTEVALLSNTFSIEGKVVSKPDKLQMKKIISELESTGGIAVEMENGLREYLADNKKVEDHRASLGQQVIKPGYQRFKVVSADESTIMLVRLGRDGRINKDLLSAFRKPSQDIDGNRVEGGHIYEKLNASLNYSQSTGIQYPEKVRELIDRINGDVKSGALSENDIHDAIVLTRLVIDRPSLIHKWTNLSVQEKKSAWKYLKLAEMKGGFVGHEENLARVRSFLEGAADLDKSGFFSNVLDQTRTFLPKDRSKPFRKMKFLSIADEMVHENNNKSILSSIEHKKSELQQLVKNGSISQRTYDENIKNYESLSKSIVDGDTFVSKEAYVANLAMIGGISPEMIKFNPDGSIAEIKIGGIKPAISHTEINTNMKDLALYGQVKEFYLKSKFAYNPEFDALLSKYKVDAITFGSSNKVNEFRDNQSSEWYNTDNTKMESTIRDGKKNVHASFEGLKEVDFTKNVGSVSEYLTKNLTMNKNNISEIPFESINLKSLGQPHDPLVGTNLGVHMHDNIGIKEWIGIDKKINNVTSAFDRYTDPYYATKLAKDLFAHSSETGDMAWLNTGIDHFLKNDGLLTAPWQRTKIEEKIIPYFMNSGMIAAGRATQGSLDVMTADTGGLNTSVIRTSRSGEKSIQFYGEFLQSKHSAEKEFKLGGRGDNPDVQSVIIQREMFAGVNFKGEYNQRMVDAFMVDRADQRYAIVEGRGIDKNGNLRDIYNDSKIPYDTIEKNGKKELTADGKKTKAFNRNLFQKLDNKEKDFISTKVLGNDSMNYSQVMTELYSWSRNKNNSMGLGSLNNRQPRNQAGDVVISRLKAFEKNGKIVTHNGDLAGNSSRMNHADAINPQDADYDMDKSSTFLAAPNRLWAEAGRLGGYRTVNDVKALQIEFDKVYSKAFPQMYTFEKNADPDLYKIEINRTDLLRGRFVKLHQTLTYLHNIFRENKSLIRMKSPIEGYNQVEIRMSTDKLRYYNSVDQVSKNVKLFLDMYKNNPTLYTENPDLLIKELIFGFEKGGVGGVKHEGLFDVYDANLKKKLDLSVNENYNQLKQAKNDIYFGLINPIGKYLKFNKGTTVDETNRDQSATLQDYQGAMRELLWNILPSRKGKNFKVEEIAGRNIYDNTSMYTSANNFFSTSSSPFDHAMKRIHSISNKSFNYDEMNPTSHVILDYLKEGKAPADFQVPQVENIQLKEAMIFENITKRAMIELQKKDGNIVNLQGLTSDLRRVNDKIEYLESIGGNNSQRIQESTRYRELIDQKLRLSELKSVVEEHLSYDSSDPQNETISNRKGGYKKTTFTNYKKLPVVVINKSGETKEVIPPNRFNVNKIKESDALVINGHRYEVVEGQIQRGLRADYNAFGGKVKHVRKDGSVIHVSSSEQAFINSEYSKLRVSIDEAYSNMPFKTQSGLAEYSARKTLLILEKLASPDFAGKPEMQIGLLFRMLRPRFNDKIIPIEPLMYGNHSKTAVIGSVKYTENKLAKAVYNTLAQVANGSSKEISGGVDKIMANRLLKDFITLSKNHYFQEETGIAVDMNKMDKMGYTEPTELPHGFMTDAKYLNKGIFERLRDGNKLEKRAAGIMYDYLSGKKLVDSATLYHASKEMERSLGISVDEQFMMKVYDRKTNTYGDTEVRNVNIMDQYRGRIFGKGGVVKKSTVDGVEEFFKCLKTKP